MPQDNYIIHQEKTDLVKRLTSEPFAYKGAKKVVDEIFADMESPFAMNRLLRRCRRRENRGGSLAMARRLQRVSGGHNGSH